MNVFKLRDQLISDYAAFVQSFMNIRDQRIHQKVDSEISAGLLWPEPLIQLNPKFKPGKSIDKLVNDGILHEECRKIFRRDKDHNGDGEPLTLHTHQLEAIEIARRGHNYVLTTCLLYTSPSPRD